MRFKSLLLILLFSPLFQVSAQPEENLKIYGALQTWIRYTELNPGSTVGANEFGETFDISVRRYRIGIKGRPYDKISYNLQIGNNNLSRYQKDQPPKVLDAYVNYHFTDKLILTGGKHGWTGLSRFAAPSTLNALGADINFSAAPMLNAHDDFFRRLAIALRGRVNKLDYRLVLSKPFLYADQPLSEQAVLVDNPTSLSFSGYFKYQFIDQESLGSAWSPATYLGEKEVFNIGLGWTYQEEATKSLSNSDTVSHPMKSFAIDLFYERPNGNNTWTAYLAYLNHDLGPEFVRYIGANNPASGEVNRLTLNGRGNSFPEAGTGQIFLGQIGFLRSFDKHGIQPNFMIEVADFDALEDWMVLYEGGINYLLDGHTSRLSLTYQSRPVFIENSNGAVMDNRKGMVVLQYQIRF